MDLKERIQQRVFLMDGAMGTQIQARTIPGRGVAGQGRLQRVAEPDGAGHHPRHPCGLLRGRQRRGRNQHLRRVADHAGRIRLADRALEINRAAAQLAREAAERVFHAGPAALRVRVDRPGHEAGDARPDLVRHALRLLSEADRRTARGRRGRHPHRDLPGPSADQGGLVAYDKVVGREHSGRSTSPSRSSRPARC